MSTETVSDVTVDETIQESKENDENENDSKDMCQKIDCVEESSNSVVSETDVKIYGRLLALEDENLVLYPLEFECTVCLEKCAKNEGIILKECLHYFCKDCVRKTASMCEEVDVKCPYQDNDYACTSIIQEKEIESLLSPEEYRARLKRSLIQAEINLNLTFHCRKPDCSWWCVNDEGMSTIQCPVCLSTNCVPCRAIHSGVTCEQYSGRSGSSGESESALVRMVLHGTAMFCPQCSTVVEKVDGCDALVCALCKTQLCWATKGRRWGPNGRGDVTAGCKCRVNGVKCHVDCCGCH